MYQHPMSPEHKEILMEWDLDWQARSNLKYLVLKETLRFLWLATQWVD